MQDELQEGITLAFILILAVGLASCTGVNNQETSAPPSSTSPTVSEMGAWDKNGDGIIVVGFSIPGWEDGWFAARTQSFKDYFIEANGFKLLVSVCGRWHDDPDSQEIQIRDFIKQGVEAIVVWVYSDYGWESLLQEAQAADIPVITAGWIAYEWVTYRSYDYYGFFFGNDPRGEADRAVAWLEAHIAATGLDNTNIRIFELGNMPAGTTDVGRLQGFEAGVEKNGWKVVRHEFHEWSRYKAREIMEAWLSANGPQDFNVIWCADVYAVLGAVDTLVAKGLDPKDYIIISFDGGGKTAVQMVKDGTIDAIAEITPWVGQQLGDIILHVSRGEEIRSRYFAVEGVIDSTNADAYLSIAYDDDDLYDY